MFRASIFVLAGLGLAVSAPCQLLGGVIGSKSTSVDDKFDYYDSSYSTTVLEQQATSNGQGLGVASYSADTAWGATSLAGHAAGNGETSLAQDAFVTSALSATYSAQVSTGEELDSTITGHSPYFGVAATCDANGQTQFFFTPTAATEIVLAGGLFAGGSLNVVGVDLVDLTAGRIDYQLGIFAPGGAAVNFSETLIAGDAYRLDAGVASSLGVQYDGTGFAQNLQGVISGTAYVNATFTPAPEPATCVLLSFGALALFRKRHNPR